MATVQQQITEAFLTKLAQTKEFDSSMIEHLRAILCSGKKPKPDDFIKAFSATTGSDLK